VVHHERHGRRRRGLRDLRLRRLARNAPIAAHVLSLGLLMLPALLALWPPRSWHGILAECRRPDCRPSRVLSRQDIEGRAYIGFRAGQLLQITLPGLAAVFFSRVARAQRCAGRRAPRCSS
jgi:hypothetical protein